MKFAISGAHGQGKTTTLKHLIPLLNMQYSIITNQTRSLTKHFSINENATDETQMEIIRIAQDVATLPLPIVADRCAWDAAAYTWALRQREQVSHDTFTRVEVGYKRAWREYTTIFYLPPVLELVDDGVRSLDLDFFNDVVWGFEKFKPTNAHTIESKTPDERAVEIYETIKRKEKIRG